MPILVDEHFAWGDKTEINQFFLKIVDYVTLFGLVDIDDFQAQGQLEVEHGRHVILAQFLGQVEDGIDERLYLVLFHLVDSVAEHPIHVPDEAFALALHAWEVEQVKHIMELGDEMREGLFRLGEAGGNLVINRHFSQFLPSVGLNISFQLIEIRFTNGGNQGRPFFLCDKVLFLVKPVLHHGGLPPKTIILHQDGLHQMHHLEVIFFVGR